MMPEMSWPQNDSLNDAGFGIVLSFQRQTDVQDKMTS